MNWLYQLARNHNPMDVMRRVDLTANVLAHPMAKLVWIVVNILIALVLGSVVATFVPNSGLTAYKIIGVGVFMAIVYPPLCKLWAALASSMKAPRASVIARAPGGLLVTLLQFLFTKRAFDHIFSQVVNDGREEYWEALSKGDKWLARWRRVQLYLSLGIAIASWISVSAIKNFIKMWKAG